MFSRFFLFLHACIVSKYAISVGKKTKRKNKFQMNKILSTLSSETNYIALLLISLFRKARIRANFLPVDKFEFQIISVSKHALYQT